MGKLLRFFEEHALKWGVAFAIFFTALYPKLPSIGIAHTWVYIRLEDFIIAVLASFWLFLLFRRKITLPLSLGTAIFSYWIAGFLSLVYSIIFISPHLANFFPSVAILSFARRIEYIILFFIALSSVRSEKDIKDYIKIVFITVTAVVIYGFGQHWYILLWSRFPAFFEKYSFCFPSFQTGNEEFAKGIPLCLPGDARTTSTFGGHYDLAGYLVLIIPLLFAAFLAAKNKVWKIYALIVTICAAILLIFTASRISFGAYLAGISVMLICIKKKRFILPVIIVSVFLLFLFSGSTVKRFLQTVRLTSVVTNNEGQIVGMAATNLAPQLQKKISKNPIIVEAPPPSQNLPQGSSFITLPQILTAPAKKTTVAVVQTPVSQDKIKQLKLANGGVEISTLTGTFLVKKALVYDISFTTRLQGEWPNAWRAFLNNPILGSGFATITLATDNDYLRALGETGILGIISFAAIFMFFGILIKSNEKEIKNLPVLNYFVFGLAGGIIGLFVNAIFIDIFEASKIAEPLWLLSGIAAGGILVCCKVKKIDYLGGMKNIFSSGPFIFIYFTIIVGILFSGTISNFFVANDFQWLHWAASASIQDFKKYFFNVEGYFYRPFDKLLIFILYSISAFTPVAYHITMLLFYLGVSFGVYILMLFFFKKKMPAFIGALLFIILPSHGENIYWISAVSSTLSVFFIVFGLIFWIRFREKQSIISYITACIMGVCALFSYELAIVFPALFILTDKFFFKQKKLRVRLLAYLPLALLIIVYGVLRFFAHATWGKGEYSYNFTHVAQNIFGNFLGYILLFTTGEHFLSAYSVLRSIGRLHAGFVLLLVVIFIIIIALFYIKYKKGLSNLAKTSVLAVSIYGFIFATISLLPVLALGHVKEQYFYLGSMGFIFFVVGIGDYFAQLLIYKKKKVIFTIFIIGITALLAFNTLDVKKESDEWQKAGLITKNTLIILQTNYSKIRPNAVLYLYLINPPQKLQNAQVFSAGLEDAVWFVYREAEFIVFKMDTIKEAKKARVIAGEHPTRDIQSYFLLFNKNGEMLEVE